jgi:hypothetical protein
MEIRRKYEELCEKFTGIILPLHKWWISDVISYGTGVLYNAGQTDIALYLVCTIIVVVHKCIVRAV